MTHPQHLRRLCGAAVLAALTACSEKPSEPLVPGLVVAVTPVALSSVAGVGVATASLPSVKVTTAGGTALSGTTVVFAIASGGGSIPTGGGSVVTDAEGIASVGSWTLGTVAGVNTLTATTSELPPVTFTATGTAGAPAKLALTTAPSATAVNRVAFATQPAAQVQDVNSNAVTTSTASITVAIASGGGTLGGTPTIAAVNGVATFTNLSIGGTVGARTLTFSATGLASATSPTITTTAGTAASVALNAGNNQSAASGTAVPIPPSVRVTDADGNGVSGTTVSYAVASGGGGVTGAAPASDASGIAAVGSWTLGATEGTNTLTATASGLTGSPITFTAMSSSAVVSAVSPATLTSGITATITGQGFSATAASNAVTIDGVAATVTAASATQLTVTVPTLPCTPGHDGVVSVSVSGAGAATRNHPVQAATQRALSVGQSVIMATAAEARCNELTNTGGLYYVNVFNTSTTYSTTGASFELRGGPGAASLLANPNVVTAPRRAPRQFSRLTTAEDEADGAHVNLLERDIQFLRENGHNWRTGVTGRSLVQGEGTANAVGDPVTLRLRDISKTGCQDFVSVTGRVAFVGTRSIIIEDNANPLAGTIDTTYAQIGNEFDTVMWPILETNFGNPVVNDARLDNNQRIIMVFTDKVRTLSNGNLAGFVSPCDFFAQTTFASSNFGEYFYATAPRVAGDISVGNSPPRWRWLMRGTIIHEVKHIVSTGERFSRNNGTVFEESWLEETTARLSEELYERASYSFAQRTNIGYGSAANPVGPYCGVRSTCNQARGIVRVFEALGREWYAAPHDHSPIGRIDANDFSFYATGWSLLRWALDASAGTEATILKGMTQEPTRTGVANFEQYLGTTLAAALPKWTLSMVLDDFPGLTPADATLRQPSWNLRNVFAGLKTDFPSAAFASWPLLPLTNTFGSFTRAASVRAGTSAIIELSGTQSAKQLLEFKASGSNAAAPAELRVAIVRVQ